MSDIPNSSFKIHHSKNPQRGASTIYIVIIIIVIIFAVMFTGGPSYLLSGDVPTSVTNTPTPPEGSTPTTNPTQAGQASGWDVTITLAANCQQGKYSYKEASVAITGQADGYITLEVNDNGYKQISTQKFAAPQGVYNPVILSNEFGFDTNEWKIGLYSGGTFTNGAWAGGTLQAEETASPTGCS